MRRGLQGLLIHGAEAMTARQRVEVDVLVDRFGIKTPVKPRDIFGAASAPTAHVVLSAVLLASGAALVQLKFAASLC